MSRRITPEELSRELRLGSSLFLKRRRGIVATALSSCAVLGAVALYQLGILKKLPQPPGRAFDTGKVNGSGEAYSILSTPDALLGLSSYAVTATLAGMGSQDRARTQPWIPLSMGLKLLVDAAVAGKLTLDECRKFRALSLWSVLTAVATWTALPLAIPEVKAAVHQLREQTHT